MSIIGAVVVFAIVLLLIGWGFWLGLILGVIAFFVLSWILGRNCDDATGTPVDAPQAHPAAAPVAPTPSLGTAQGGTEPAAEASVAEAVEPASGQDVAGGTAESEAEAAPTAAASATVGHWSSGVSASSGKASPNRGQSALKPTATLAEEGTLRDGVGAWKYSADGVAPAPKAAAPAPAQPETAPETLSGARDGGADDLTRIKGVGPGIEKTLNELGFYHFDQIAAWTDQDIVWVDSRLKFKGRIVRDNWVDQARAFAQDA